MEYWESSLRNKNRGFMKLIVWQRAIVLFQLVWEVVYRREKVDFKLRAQVADAAQSVSANISEGYGRRSAKEYIQFLYFALGSMGETLTRTIGLHITGHINDSQFNEINELHYEVENRLLRLIEKIEQKRDDDDWVARIAEDPAEYMADASTSPITPSLQNSITPSKAP